VNRVRNVQVHTSSSFLGSTAQLRPWPPPQNPAEFLGGFSTILFLQGRVVSPTPNPHPGGPGLCIYIPQRQGGYPFSCLLRHAWVTVGLFLFPGHHTGRIYENFALKRKAKYSSTVQ
jgi:hypothetical protein